MQATLPLRLEPGDDLRAALESALAAAGAPQCAFVVAGIGSLGVARIRLAGASEATPIPGPFEILTLCGTVSPDGAHLHASLADREGRVIGGHLAPGCIVGTTAEILLAPLEGWRLSREADARTGYRELTISRA